MNGRKREWKGGRGEEKGTDFPIKFSGHLNKHLSRQSNGRAAGGRCVSWAMLEALQQDTSNKQHLKKHACSPSQGVSSEIPPPQFPPCLQPGLKLASISNPILPHQQGGARLRGPLPELQGPSPHPALLPGVREWLWDPKALCPWKRSHPVLSHPAACCLFFFLSRAKEQRERAETDEPLKTKMKAYQWINTALNVNN